MLSDNASTYVTAARKLEQLRSLEKLRALGHQVAFHSPKSFTERLVGMTKTTIKKVLGSFFITSQALQTSAVEIEAVLIDL